MALSILEATRLEVVVSGVPVDRLLVGCRLDRVTKLLVLSMGLVVTMLLWWSTLRVGMEFSVEQI